MTGAEGAAAGASLVEMAQGYFRGRVLCAAVRLGVADAMGDGERDLASLASATASNPDSLFRLLRALAAIGITIEVAPGRFALTAMGQPLRRDSPHSVWASIVFWADLLADSWTYLPECVRAGGKAGADAAMAASGARSRWSQEPDAQAIFHAVFSEADADAMRPLVDAYDFSACRVVADLGGAGGGLIAAVLAAHPTVRGMLVDRPAAVERARARLTAHGFTARCDLIAGDLQEAVPAGADVYLMKCVLHGYDDAGARRILQNCRSVMTAASRLLLIEAVLPALITRPDPVVERNVMSDLNMLAVTGGHERSTTQWDALLTSAGLRLARVIEVGNDSASIIEAAPRPEGIPRSRSSNIAP